MPNFRNENYAGGGKVFLGRVYNQGSGDAMRIQCLVEGNDLTVSYLDQEMSPVPASLDQFEVRLGGSDDDKIVLNHLQTGAHIVLNDLSLIDALERQVLSAELDKQIRRAKWNRFTRRFRNRTGLAAFVAGLVFFMFWVIIGFSYYASEEGSGEGDGAKQAASAESSGKAKTDLLNSYSDEVARTIGSAWSVPKVKKDLLAMVSLSVKEDGKIAGGKLVKGSGNKAFDNSVLKVVSSSTHLEYAPPDGVSEIRMTLRFELKSGEKSVIVHSLQ